MKASRLSSPLKRAVTKNDTIWTPGGGCSTNHDISADLPAQAGALPPHVRALSWLGAKRRQLRELLITVIQLRRGDALNLLQIRRVNHRPGTQINIALSMNLGDISHRGISDGLVTAAVRAWHRRHPMVISPSAPSTWVRFPPTHTPLTYWPLWPSGAGSRRAGGLRRAGRDWDLHPHVLRVPHLG